MRQKTKHTPGPWSVLDEENRTYVIDAEDCTVAIIPMDRTPGNTERADAALISAAPEMLEALDIALSALSDVNLASSNDAVRKSVYFAHSKVSAVIEKAKGGVK